MNKTGTIESFFEKFGQNIVRLRWILIIFTLLIAFICSFGIKQLKTSVSLKNLFLANDPVIIAQQEFDNIFGNSDFVGVLVESEDIISNETLALIKNITDDLQNEVSWLSGTSSILDFLGKEPLFMSVSELEELREKLDKRNNIRGVLYSEDYKQAWILCTLETYPKIENTEDSEEPSYTVGREVMNIIDHYQAEGARVLGTGIPVLEFRKSSEMFDDLTKVIFMAAIAAVCLIVLLSRSLASSIGSVFVVGIAILSVFGVLGWFKQTVDTTFMLVPVLLTIAVSIGYSVHVFIFFNRNMHITGKRKESVIIAIKETGWPVLFTALTTIFALLSFIVVPIRAIQWVGLISATSIIVVYMLTMVFFPSILAIGKDRPDLVDIKKNNLDDITTIDKTEKLLSKISTYIMNHRKVIVVVYIIIMIISIIGLSRIKVDLNAQRMMGLKMPHIRDQAYISDSPIGANYAYSIALKFPGKNEALTSEVLGKVDELSEFINQTSFIKRVTSINNMIKEANQIRHKDNSDFHIIPEKDSSIRGLVTYIKRLSPGSLDSLVDKDNKILRILVETNDVSTSSMVNHIEIVNFKLKELFPSSEFGDFDYILVGGVLQLSVMNQYITKGLIQSVLIALIVISIMMMIVFRSLKLGLISMIPNISPVIIAGGLMGFMGEPLEFVTMTVAPMVIGLAVDDTIHFINHVKVDFRRNRNYDIAIRNSFIKVGKALIQASTILCITFLMFTTSNVHSMVNMGIYIIVAMISALIADFTVTPILLKKSRAFGKEN